ncbi:MAG TPA: sialidase family protein [Verrucomicrobiae bacterium]|jgi:hypothetical protein
MKAKFVSFKIAFFLIAIATPLYAGQYFQEFSSFADGTTSFGDGSLLLSTSLGTASGAGVQGSNPGALQLIGSGTTSVTSAFKLPDLDPGKTIYAFSAKWNADVKGIFPSAGYGFSFNFGQLAPLNLISTSYTPESGYPTGMCFSVNLSGFNILMNGSTVASAPYNPSTQWGMNSSTNHFFEVDWNCTNGITVHVDGAMIFTNVPTPGLTFQAGNRFVWAARSMAPLGEEVRLDNIVVMSGGNLIQILTASPYYSDSEEVEPAVNAFDGNLSTSWADYNLINSPIGYVGATVSPAATVSVYALVSPQSVSYLAGAPSSPAGWILQGSGNNGSSWANCGTGVGHFVNSLETRCWMATNFTSYGAYRLNVDVGNGYVGLGLAELRFYTFVPVIPTGWTFSPAPGDNDWSGIASSGNGNILAGIIFSGGIYLSTNAGASWSESSAPLNYWESISISEDGTKLIAGSNNNGVYTSSDSGANWFLTSLPGAKVYDGTTLSSNGNNMVVVTGNGAGPGVINTSANSGTTWSGNVSPNISGYGWTSVASSSDGKTVIAGSFGVGVYVSTDSGASWRTTSLGNSLWKAVACSDDGTKMLVVNDNTSLYTSTDGGVTWILAAIPANAAAISADGTKMFSANTNGVFVSSNGNSWTNTDALALAWNYLASSSDGNKLIAASGNQIWVYGTVTPAPPVIVSESAMVEHFAAALGAQCDANFLPTTVWFQWGSTSNYGNVSSTEAIDASQPNVNILINGLTLDTVYHSRVIASNLLGIVYGSDFTFTTESSNTLFAFTEPLTSVIPTSTNSPAGQTAAMAIDGTASTEYVNNDVINTGFTVFPVITNVSVRAISLISAGDSTAASDPASFILYGSPDGTHFTEIVSNAVPPFTAREAIQSFPFANTNTYAAYKIIFPTVVDPTKANSLQIGQVEFLPYSDITSTNDALTLLLPNGAYLYNGGPTNALLDRQLNDQTNEIVVLNDTTDVVALITPAAGSSIVKGVELIGGFNDTNFPEREPSTLLLEGSNDGTNYTTLLSVTPQMPASNQQIQGFSCAGNTNAYQVYRATFGPPDAGDIIEVAELRLLGVTQPKFTMTSSEHNLSLTWPVSGFTLQESTNLASANWLAATNGIVVTNGQSLVTIPAKGNHFYRLQSQ